MMLLGIETSSSRCSVALGNASFAEELVNDTPREHHALLLPMVARLLESCHARLEELDAIAFGCGPGSFTGLRIAASVAQGLAFGAGLPVLPVSSLGALALAALADAADEDWSRVLVATDAHMGEVYWSLFGVDAAIPLAIDVDRLDTVADWRPAGVVDPRETLFAGEAWRIYPQLLPPGACALGDVRPGAREVVRLAALLPGSARIAPEHVEPLYVRSASLWKKSAGR